MHRLLACTLFLTVGAITAAAQAAPIAAPAKVTPPTAGKYKGKTAQGKTVAFTVSRKHYVTGTFPARLKCPDGYAWTFAFNMSRKRKIRSDGAFGPPYSGPDNHGNSFSVAVKGRRSGSKSAKGTLRITVTWGATHGHGGDCTSGLVKWTAKRH